LILGGDVESKSLLLRIVLTIGASAFKRCYSLSEVLLQEGRLESIGDEAFCDCKSLSRIVLPSTVKTIGYGAFQDCTSLFEIRLNERLKSIGGWAFKSCCSLTNIVLPEGLEQIASGTFVLCKSLCNIRIPSSVERIERKVFYGCESLKNVHLLEGRLVCIDDEAFGLCSSLGGILLPHGLLFIGACCFHGCTSLSTISVPSTVHAIGASAFVCSAITDVELHEGLECIGMEAFESCALLSAVALPSTLDTIGEAAFSNCTSLLGAEFPPNCTYLEIGDECFRNCKSLVNVSLPPSVNDRVGNIFTGCDLLQNHGGCRPRDSYSQCSLHQVCYNSSSAKVDDVIRALDSSEMIEDEFGMTAFHIVATSANPRVEILECLLDRHPMEMLSHKDKYGRTMLDYLLMHTSSKAVPLIKVVLQKAVVDRMITWHIGAKWESILSQGLESISDGGGGGGGVETRRKQMRDSFFGDVGYCLRVEMASLSELALWKMKINEGEMQELESYGTFRDQTRFQSGAGVVIENMVDYLWNADEPGLCTALSIFSL